MHQNIKILISVIVIVVAGLILTFVLLSFLKNKETITYSPSMTMTCSPTATATPTPVPIPLPTAMLVPLARNIGEPPSADWDDVISKNTVPAVNQIFAILKKYNAPPSMTLAIQSNPKANVEYDPPTLNPNQTWISYGVGISNKTPMRIASVSKPFTQAIFLTTYPDYLSQMFYELWVNTIGPLPEPLDLKFKQITIQMLIDHVSGMTNDNIGYDPAFEGMSVQEQLPTILTQVQLESPASYNYSNFGYMILGALSASISSTSYLQQVKLLLPDPISVPIYNAGQYIPVNIVTSEPPPHAEEPKIYYIRTPDDEFDVLPMIGNGSIVTDCLLLSWFGNKYRIDGPGKGTLFGPGPYTEAHWTFAGSMPGTTSFIAQRIQSNQVSALAMCVNTRQVQDPVTPGGDSINPMAEELYAAAAQVLTELFP
jgi:hypothetical protein